MQMRPPRAFLKLFAGNREGRGCHQEDISGSTTAAFGETNFEFGGRVFVKHKMVK